MNFTENTISPIQEDWETIHIRTNTHDVKLTHNKYYVDINEHRQIDIKILNLLQANRHKLISGEMGRERQK